MDLRRGHRSLVDLAISRRESQRAWREKNREYLRGYMKEYMRRWKEKNPERVKAYKSANRKRVKLSGLVALMAAQGGRCALCGDSVAVDRHLDHKLPRSRGGADEMSNYQWLCPPCNVAKGEFTNEEFLAHIRKILSRAGG